jgi:hypothetical protein
VDFLKRLLDGVGDFFHVDLADDVEGVLGHIFRTFLNKEFTLEIIRRNDAVAGLSDRYLSLLSLQSI